jgi:hypothetical protein
MTSIVITNYIYIKMKKILLSAIILFFCNLTYSQRVVIRGVVIDSTNGNSEASIVINDTINKLTNKMDNDSDFYWRRIYFKMSKTEKLYYTTKKNGYFKIKARLKDTLRFSSNEHKDTIILVKDLAKKKNIKILLTSLKCNSKPCPEDKLEYLTLIGTKIKVDHGKRGRTTCGKYTRITMDSSYDAVFKVDSILKGNYKNNTIKFGSSDHYGRPEFCKYKNVVLFLVKICTGKFVQRKYQYYDCYKTKNNRWAVPYKTIDYSRIDTTKIKIKPIIIDFEKPVEYDIRGWNLEIAKKKFPEPYYTIVGDKAIAIYGNFIEEILEIKQHIDLLQKEMMRKSDADLQNFLKSMNK